MQLAFWESFLYCIQHNKRTQVEVAGSKTEHRKRLSEAANLSQKTFRNTITDVCQKHQNRRQQKFAS